MNKTILVFLNILFFSCSSKKKPNNEPCKVLSVHDKTQNFRNEYFEYDSQNRMILMVRKWPVNNVKVSFLQTRFSYNPANQLIKTEYEHFVNDSLESEGTLTFTWHNNQIVRSDDYQSDKTNGYVNYHYNTSGQLIETEAYYSNFFSRRVFTYDSNNVVIKASTYNHQNRLIHLVDIVPIGKKAKTYQSLWRKAGLTLDVSYAAPIYDYNYDKFVYIEYKPDKNGKLVESLRQMNIIPEIDEYGYIRKRVVGKDTVIYRYETCK